VTDPSSLNTTYQFDGLSDATGQASPDTGSTTRTFDAAGDVLIHTDAKGVVATSTYDALNRTSSVSYVTTTQNVSYTYDEANSVTGCSSSYPIGRLTRIVENAVTTVYCYDARGNVVAKQQITSNGTDSAVYAYTAASRLSSITYPSGSKASYAFDGDGRIQIVSLTPVAGGGVTAVSSVSYLPFGPITGYTLGNGQTITRSYDANYRLTDITSTAFSLHVAHDAMGDVTALGSAPGANPAIETYAYDPLYRLINVTEAGGAVLQSYTYNGTGDRLSKTGSGLATGTYTYATGTHQLTATGNTARVVDADGNTTAMTQAGEVYGFGYNSRNRMTVAQASGATVGSYAYNALGQRIGKVAASTQRFGYDEASHLIGEYGTSARDYVWLGDIPVAVIDTSVSSGSTTCYPVSTCRPNGGPVGQPSPVSPSPGTSTSVINYVYADGLGTPRAVANSVGTVIWQWAYQGNAFGELQPTSTTGYTLNLRYPGQYYDAETGTNYNLFRNYEPSVGRYQQSDPIGLAGGISTYAYVGSDPLDYIDPLGLAPHQYTVTDFICYAAQSGCTPQNVFNQLRRYPAPFSDGNPVSTGDISNIPGLGHVVHTVDPTHCSVTNTTEPDHTLYPGQVTRSVVQNADGSIDVVTTGTGDGAFSALNDALADPLWGAVDWNVASPWVAQPPAFNHY